MFNEFAPRYWAVGLPVIPLRPRMKVPALNAWSQYASAMPTQNEKTRWLESYQDGNIGLPLGPQSGVIALDLDSEDPKVLAILMRLMPPTPLVRKGKKGAVYVFKYSGERTYRIKDGEGAMVCELLSRGAQIVLPPSIHPDTQMPYTSNSELYEVLGQLNPLPSTFETDLRQALLDTGYKLSARGAAKVSEWTPAGGRDSAMISHAGILARGVVRGERTLMEAINEIQVWIDSYTEKVAGDPLDPSKGRDKVMEFVRRDITEGGRKLPPGWSAGMSNDELKETRKFFGQDFEEKTITEILNDFQREFVDIPKEEISPRTAVIDGILLRLAKSDTITELDKEVALKYISTVNGKVLTIAALRKRMNDLEGGELQGKDHSELARATIKELERDGEVRFSEGYFYRWYGSHWKSYEEHEILGVISKEFGHYPAAKRFSDHRGILSVMSKIAAKHLRDVDCPGINFANGYFTTDGELLAHDSRYGCTYVLPYRYAPHDRAPSMFMSFLDQAWGMEPDYLERLEALKQAIAVSLFGQAYVYQKAFLLYGLAGSGKSTLLDIILGLTGRDSSSSVLPQDWGDKFMPAQMSGKLMNFAGELSESRKIPGSIFKSVIDGTQMQGQHKNAQIFMFRPTCAHWFCSNYLPRSGDTSNGFNRRWLIFSFNYVIPEKERQVNLAKEILNEEREAIVAWAAPAMQELMKQGTFTSLVSHEQLIGEVANVNNSVRAFLVGGGIKLRTEGTCSERSVYNEYQNYCRMSSHSMPFNSRRFRIMTSELQQELGFTVTTIKLPSGEEKTTYSGFKLPDYTNRVL